MVRTSVPDSSKWTANPWRSEWGVIGLRMREIRRAFRQASSTELLSMGWPSTSPSNSHPFGRTVSGAGQMPSLADLIEQRADTMDLGSSWTPT